MAMMPSDLSHALMAPSLLEALMPLISSSFWIFWMSHARRRLFEPAMSEPAGCGCVEHDECKTSAGGLGMGGVAHRSRVMRAGGDRMQVSSN